MTSDQDTTLEVEGKAKVPTAGAKKSAASAKAKQFKLKPKSVELQGGVTEAVRLKLKQNRKSVNRIGNLIKAHKKARKKSKAIAEASASNANGSSAATKLKIKLKA